MKTFRQSLGFLIAGLLLFFLLKPFIQTHKQLEDITLQIQWQWLVTSFGCILVYRSCYIWPFTKLLRCISQGHHVPFRNAFTLFHSANITRYLPGRIWGVVRMVSLSKRFRLSKTATISSLTLHVGIETALGGLIAMSLLFSTHVQSIGQSILERISGHTVLFTLAIIGILVGGLFCIPKLTNHTRQFLKTLLPPTECETLVERLFQPYFALDLPRSCLLFICPKFRVRPMDTCRRAHSLLCFRMGCWLLKFPDPQRTRHPRGTLRAFISKLYVHTRITALSPLDAVG